jgi:uncharacterized membrane protein
LNICAIDRPIKGVISMFEALAYLVGFVMLVLILDARSQVKRLQGRVFDLERGTRKQGPLVAALAPERPNDAPAAQPARQSATVIYAAAEVEPVSEPLSDIVPEHTPELEPEFAPEAAIETLVAEAPVLTTVTAGITRNSVADVPTPTAARRSMSINFEELFGRRLPIWAGGITLAIAGVLIVKYAIDAGLLTPWVRVLGGLLFGAGLISGAEAASRNEDRIDDPRVRQALSGAGLATLYATILMASNTYGLIGPVAAFIGMAAVTAGALALSIRFGPPSALLGLAGGLATPALVGSLQPDVPMLALYLALTIGGLTAVSRMQRWAWLGISALIGGAGWSAWMIVNGAFDAVTSLSIGALVMLLALGLPVIAFGGPRAALMRAASTLVGAGQLALMIALGGFTPLHWGLFALLAAAAQWLSWREQGFGMVPGISLGLSAMLLAVWPDPDAATFITVGLVLAAIHGGPLLARLWHEPARLNRTLELAGLSFAIPILPAIPFYVWDGSRDVVFAGLCVAGAVLMAVAMRSGWRRDARTSDARFAILTGTMGVLTASAAILVAPTWAIPLGVAGVAMGLLILRQKAGDQRIEWIAAAGALSALALLTVTAAPVADEAERLVGLGEAPVTLFAVLRWAGLTTLGVFFALRSQNVILRRSAQAIAAALAYGTIAQILPQAWLPLVPGLGVLGLALWSRRLSWPALAPALGVAVSLVLFWAFEPGFYWTVQALLSLGGKPMLLGDMPTLMMAKQVIVPGILVGAALWRIHGALPLRVKQGALIGVGTLGVIGTHSLFKQIFRLSDATFPALGLVERLIWTGLLMGGGLWLSQRRDSRPVIGRIGVGLAGAGTLFAGWYTLVLHNPLWAAQAIGWPIFNLLPFVFGGVPFGLWLITRMVPAPMARVARGVDILKMVLVALFAHSLLMTVFSVPPLLDHNIGDTESILHSILAIMLAIGFLLWGIRIQSRDWRIASLVLMIAAVAKVFLVDAAGLDGLLRIASFVALGFSLIGIGWLYSRQLSRAADGPSRSDRPSL